MGSFDFRKILNLFVMKLFFVVALSAVLLAHRALADAFSGAKSAFSRSKSLITSRSIKLADSSPSSETAVPLDGSYKMCYIPNLDWESVYEELERKKLVDGFRADHIKVDNKIQDMGTADVYGEILSSSIREIICSKLELDESDVVYDLGHGTGKVPVLFALETKVGTSKGIELGEQRFKGSVAALSELKKRASDKDDLRRLEKLEYIKGSVLVESFEDATVLFMNMIALPDEVFQELVQLIAVRCTKLKYILTFEKPLARVGDDLYEELGGVLIGGKSYSLEQVGCAASWRDDGVCNIYTRQ